MKILICDDEALARQRLRAQLDEMNIHRVVAEAANGIEALARCEEFQPDIVLLDIRMPGMDGIEAARHLAQWPQPPAVIFTTAYDEHVLQAFEADATDYLLKPIRKERLAQALAKASKLTRVQQARLQALHTQLQGSSAQRTHICAYQRGNLVLVPIKEIIYLHADQKYVTVKHTGGEILIDEALKVLEQEFADCFVRIHRASLVARRFIVGLERDNEGSFFVVMQHCTEKLEVSRRHLADVRKLIKNEL